MPIVVDVSVAASWILPDEDSAVSILARLAADHGLVPELWWFEVYNLLTVAERRKRISTEKAEEARDFLADLPIEIDHHSQGQDILALARVHRLTGYDASYLELARRHHLPLATFDQALLEAAPKEGVRLIATD